MGIANQAQLSSNSPIVTPSSHHKQYNSNPMSQDYHHQGTDEGGEGAGGGGGGGGGFFLFSASDGFERVQEQQQHIAQQMRRFVTGWDRRGGGRIRGGRRVSSLSSTTATGEARFQFRELHPLILISLLQLLGEAPRSRCGIPDNFIKSSI